MSAPNVPGRILFIGGTERGYRSLQTLIELGATIPGAILLQQDEHEKVRYEEQLKLLCAEHGIPSFETKWMKDRDYLALIRDQLKPDLTLVVGCRILLPPEIVAAPALGTFAVHDSLLPEYRGFAPLNWAIINREASTGVTLFKIDDGMDTGDIFGQKKLSIGPDETAPQLYEKVCDATLEVIRENLLRILAGELRGTPQKPGQGSYTCPRIPADGLIDWKRPTFEIHALVRALAHPYPGAFTYYKGRKLFVWGTKIPDAALNYKGRIPGRIVRLSKSDGSVDILTGDGVLRLTDVQLEGAARGPATCTITTLKCSLGLSELDLHERLEALKPRS